MRSVVLALALVLSVPFVSFAAPVSPLGTLANTNVHISNFAFSPQSVTVDLGDTVTWDNQDGVTHTVTADDLSFDSGNLASGATFTRGFNAVGTVSYHCKIHTTMTGKVIVVDPNALPDLVITSVVATESTPGLVTSVSVTVANVGTNAAGASMTSLVYLYKGTPHAIGSTATPSLAPGANTVASFTWATTGKVGTFTIVATADSTNVVRESNETNNEGTATASVLTSALSGIDVTDP